MSSLRALLLPLLLSLACGGVLPLGQAKEPVFVEVMVPFPGAAPATLEAEVAAPLEAAVGGIPGLASTWNRSEEGQTALRLRFEGGTDPWAARAQVMDALQGAQLPDGAETPLLLSLREAPVATFLARADTPWQAAELARALRERVVQLPGVQDAVILGETEQVLQVRVAADRLKALDLAPAEVLSALDGARTGALLSGDRVLIRVGGSASLGVEELADVVLRPGVRLGDVAELRLEELAADGQVHTADGKPTALLEVYGLPPEGSARDRRLHGEALLGSLAAMVSSLPDAALRLPAQRARVALHAVSKDALESALSRGGLPPDTVLVPGSPPELWSWSVSARELAEHVGEGIPGVQPRALLPAEQTLMAVIRGPDLEVLEAVRSELVDALRASSLDGTVVPQTPAPQPELDLRLDRERLAALGLGRAQVTEAIRVLHGSELPGDPRIRLTVEGLGSAEDPGSVQLLLRGPEGLVLVPLSALASVTVSAQPTRLDRVDHRGAELVSIDLEDPSQRDLVGAAVEALSLPPQVTVELRPCPACP